MTPSQFLTLVDVQAKMALRASAAGFYLGYIWWILEPLLFVGVFYLVFDVILDSRRADFLLFLFTGKLPFMWFASSVNSAASSIFNSRGLVGQLWVPKAVFPLAKVHEAFYKQLAVFALMFAVLVFAGFTPNAGWLLAIPLIATQYLLIIACAMIASVLVCYARDFVKLISLGLTMMMFISGIFWDVRELSDPALTQLLLTFNPLAFLLDGYRQILLYDQGIDLAHLSTLALCSGIAIWLMFRLMRRLDSSLAIRVIAG